MEELVKYGVPWAAFALSIASFWLAWRNWRQSNRPIVATMIRTHEEGGGNVMIIYDLVVLNAGTRPAVDVRLVADESELIACLIVPDRARDDNAAWRGVKRCFQEISVIPLLPQGSEASNSFGYTTDASASNAFWKYRSKFPIRAIYSDLEGRSYESKQVLTICDSVGFADGHWRKVT